MKKRFVTPAFEFIFATGVVMCLVLPPAVIAQNHQELTVTINNGDTTVNGKNMKDLSPTERKTALQNISGINKNATTMATSSDNTTMLAYVRRRNDMGGRNRMMQKEGAFSDDTTRKGPQQHRNGMGGPGGMQRGPGGMQGGQGGMRAMRGGDMQANNRHFGHNGMHGGDRHGRGFGQGHMPMGPQRRNSEHFSYSTTNSYGISTRINYEVGDVNKETLKKISGADAADLTVNDLLLIPSFSTGKTMLTFGLADKGSAEVAFKDSEGKNLWTEKASGTLTKSFELPMNGIYYLQVKQNGKVTLRRILKKE